MKDKTTNEVMFFFNDAATTEIYALSLHGALPIWSQGAGVDHLGLDPVLLAQGPRRLLGHLRHLEDADDRHVAALAPHCGRSEEHTSELQSRQYLVCRLLLEKQQYLVSPPLLVKT